MENYDRDDAFLEIVNGNHITTEKFSEISAAVAKNIRAEELREDSKKAATIKYEEQVKKCNKYLFWKRLIITAFMLSLLTGGIVFTAEYGQDFVDTNAAISIMASNANRVLEARRLSSYSMIDDNNVSDYRNLNISDISEIYIYMYKSVISRSTEEKMDFIKSICYIGESGRLCYYSDINDFLIRNNFKSEKEFKDFARKKILESYRLGQIKELPFDGMGTVNRGGKGI